MASVSGLSPKHRSVARKLMMQALLIRLLSRIASSLHARFEKALAMEKG
jgi:hypothetical protein